jgi:hypothetical protein
MRVGGTSRRRQDDLPAVDFHGGRAAWGEDRRDAPVPVGPAASGGAVSTWQLSLAIWPVENRPALMKDVAVVNQMELKTFLTYKKNYEDEVARQGKGHEEFGRDRMLPVRRYKEQDDDCTNILHDLR